MNIATGCLRTGKRNLVLFFISSTIIMGVVFEFIQLHEYKRAAFTMQDRVFGRTFYLLTGFHGLHVIAGLSFLIFNWLRMIYFHFSTGFSVA